MANLEGSQPFSFWLALAHCTCVVRDLEISLFVKERGVSHEVRDRPGVLLETGVADASEWWR